MIGSAARLRAGWPYRVCTMPRSSYAGLSQRNWQDLRERGSGCRHSDAAGLCRQRDDAGRAGNGGLIGPRPSVRVIVVRRAFVAGVIVVVRMRSAVQFVGVVPMLALPVTVAVCMLVPVVVVVRMGMLVGMRMMQVAVPVPVLVRMRVFVRMPVRVVVLVAGVVGGLVVRHRGLLQGRCGTAS